MAAIKELTAPNDVRVIIAYEEAHENRQRSVSAAQTRAAAIAHEVVGHHLDGSPTARPGAEQKSVAAD